MSEKITLELMNPRGKIEVTPATSPSPRLDSLDGKTVGLYSNSKPGMDNFYTAIEELLRERYPDIKINRLTGAFEIRDDDAKDFISGIDAFIYAVGD